MITEPLHVNSKRTLLMPKSAHVHDIFFDPAHRRWRIVQIVAALTLLFAIMGVALSWQPLQQPIALRDGAVIPPMPHLNLASPAPTIGLGPLIRLVKVNRIEGRLTAIDPITNRVLGAITGNDASQVGNAPLALQRYGYSSAVHKTIELTFDDGPDPIWTPKILNLLSSYKAAATFFVIGAEVSKYPEIGSRESQEGFSVGNHTLTHPDLTPDSVRQQFVSNDRIIRASTGIATNLIRLPYDGLPKGGKARDLNAILINAQRLGYIVSMEEFDTEDWTYAVPAQRPKTPIPLPSTRVDNITVLLHDGGGDRSTTLAYLKRLLPWGLAHGYTFRSLPQVSPQVAAGTRHISPSVWDYEALWLSQAILSWPNTLIEMLFVMAIFSVVVGGGINVSLAIRRRLRNRRRQAVRFENTVWAHVSIVVAAYNEEKVIRRTLEALCCSQYRAIREIIVVDDGSSDRTRDIVTEMTASDRRIRVLRQKHGGKAEALNRAFTHARSPIIVTLDADTVIATTTIGNLVRHFTPQRVGRLGAVGGVVKVGNQHNMLTRCQALEYITMTSVDRGAQDAMHAIMVVPGACTAWSREAVLQVGGFSRSTLAEDCDLALTLQQADYVVSQDDEAICFTEAPETICALARQRFRWMYGTIQAMWKHRTMILIPHYGWLGMLTMPLAVISLLFPVIFMPLVYAMAVATFVGQGMGLLLGYIATFLIVQLVTSAVGVGLAHERPAHLLMVPIYRVIYDPLRAYILYKSALTILRGAPSRWNKLRRNGTVTLAASNAEADVA